MQLRFPQAEETLGFAFGWRSGLPLR